MTDPHDHVACVEAWRTRLGRDASAAQLLHALERDFRAVWRRAQMTLGDVTLVAIGDRVLHDAAEQHPILNAVRLEPVGISCEDLRTADALDVREVDAAAQSVMLGLLTVLGRLTAEVLTPALHAELSVDRDQESAP